jgi:hypothetical protein
VLQIAQLVQEQRDSRRSGNTPVRTNQGKPAVPRQPAPGKKAQRALDADDLVAAIKQTESKRPIVST